MEFVYGLVTFWFVMAGALFIHDANKGALEPWYDYLRWPYLLIRRKYS